MKRGDRRAAAATRAFVEPTSVTVVSSAPRRASRRPAPASCGDRRRDDDEVRAGDRVLERPGGRVDGAPLARRHSRAAGSASKPTIVSAPAARAASPMEAPIRPVPMIARRMPPLYGGWSYHHFEDGRRQASAPGRPGIPSEQMKRLALQTTHLLLDFPLGIFWFVVIVTGISTGLGLLITLIGLPILTVTFLLVRAGAELEIRRTEAFLGIEVRRPPKTPPVQGWLAKLLAPFRDPASWKALLYHGLVLPVRGVFDFVIVVTLVTTSGAAAALPFYFWALPHHGIQINDHSYWNDPWQIALITLAGLVLGYVTVWVIRGLAWVDVQFVRGLLGASRTASLERRVDAAMDASDSERKRIERDLHDGAQQRLVALGMDLGLRRRSSTATRRRPRRCSTDAHEEAKEALAELRDLVRGIHPAVLTDRGLDAALSALAARAPVPVRRRRRVARAPAAVRRGCRLLRRRARR